jgi:hypothetical protein
MKSLVVWLDQPFHHELYQLMPEVLNDDFVHINPSTSTKLWQQQNKWYLSAVMIFISCMNHLQDSPIFHQMKCYNAILKYLCKHSTKALKSVLNSTSLCQWHKSTQHCKWRKSAFITCAQPTQPGHGSAVQKTQDTFISALGYSIRHTDYHQYISGHRHQLNDISHSQCCRFLHKPLPHLKCWYMHCITVNSICTPCDTKNSCKWIIKEGSCPSWTTS